MKPKSFEKMLEQDAAPPPDPKARLAARHAALAEFRRVNASAANEPVARRSFFQVLADAMRPSREAWYSRRMLVGGAASACLAIVGLTLVWNTVRQDPQITELPAPVAATVGDAGTNTDTGNEIVVPPPDSAAATQDVPALGPAETEASARGDLAQAQAAAAAASREQQAVESRAQALEAKKLAAQGEPLARRLSVGEVPADKMPAPSPAVAGASANAQGQPQVEEVVVSGSRIRRQETVMTSPVTTIDSITAEDVGQMPDSNVHLRRSPPPASPPAARQKAFRGVLRPSIPADDEYIGRDRFQQFDANPVKRAAEEPVSTLSVDVDTASYSFVRRQLEAGVLPQKDAVRVEEMINYFSYAWPAAESRAQPFKPTVVISDSPWGKGRKLVHIGIKGYEIPAGEQPDANLVLLMDVSGSMSSPDRLPLAIQSMELLLGSLKPTDTVAIVVYAGAAGKVLDPTPVRDREKIVEALHRLQAGGSTAGAEGIKLAYELAEASFRKGGVNRILLATDGDFNVGIDSTEELKGYVERQREKGIFLSVLGYGMGNYRDEMAQALAQNGNGVAAYIDTINEARKVLVEQATGSLFTIAKDVKLQVEFNDTTVAEYRLVGYETRALKREDFKNDAVDAGDVGAGHTVTAIYEITPAGSGATMIDPLRFRRETSEKIEGDTSLYGFLKIRYKLPDESESKELQQPIEIRMPAANAAVKRDVQFSTAVAGFAQLLRGGAYVGKLKYDDIIEDAQASLGDDRNGHRAEFVRLVRKARTAKGM